MFVCVRVQEKLVVRTAVVLVIVSRTVLNLRQYRTSRHRTSAVRTTLLLAPRTGRTTGNTGQQLKRLKKSIVIAATDRLYKWKSSQVSGMRQRYWLLNCSLYEFSTVRCNWYFIQITETSKNALFAAYHLKRLLRCLLFLPSHDWCRGNLNEYSYGLVKDMIEQCAVSCGYTNA